MKKIPPLLAILLLAISTSCHNNSGNNTENTVAERGNTPRSIEEKIAEIKCIN